MRENKSSCIFKNPLLQLVLLTLFFQSTNFIFDWKNLKFYDRLTINNTVNIGDNIDYSGIARNLLLGNGYTAPFTRMTERKGTPTYLRSPGLPLLYTIPLFLFCRDNEYAITESNKANVWLFLYLFNLILVCIGTVYFYKVLHLFFKDSFLSFMGTVTYIIWPSNLVFLSPSFAFLAEPVVVPLLIWIFYVLLTNKNILTNFLAGFVLGYCILTRVYLVLLPLSFFLMSFFFQNDYLKKGMRIITFVAFAIMLPWPIRNYLVFNDFSLSSQTGQQLLMSNNASARGSWDGIMWNEGLKNPQRYPVLKNLDQKYPGLLDMTKYTETQASKIYQYEAIIWMKTHPTVLPWLMMRKLAITFYPTNFESNNKVNILTASIFLLFLPGFLLFLYRCLKKAESTELLLLIIPIICMCIVNLIFNAEYRYRFVMEPFIIMFAIYGAAHLGHVKHSVECAKGDAPPSSR